MGSFSNNQEGNVVNDTTGKSFDFNRNAVANNQSMYTYNPAISSQDYANTTAASQDIGSALNTLQQPYNVNDAFNNPFYSSTDALYTQPINEQFAQQSNNLTNQLSAQNQTGSSYDALQNYYLDQNYDNSINTANNQARQSAYNAYNQTYNNALSTLQGAENYASQYNQNLYAPLQQAISYQNALTPLQEMQANYYASKPTSGDEIAGIGGAAAGGFLGA